MKKLIVIFPGVDYGLDSPLLYYADFMYEVKGFERIHMNYQSIFSNREFSLDNKLNKVREYVWGQVKDVDFALYDEVVFLSKSIGSVEAGLLAQRLGIEVIHIFISPIEEAISYCNINSYVVMGTQDKAYPIYKEYCDKYMLKTLYVEDANHSLEVTNKPYESIDVLKNVMQFIER